MSHGQQPPPRSGDAEAESEAERRLVPPPDGRRLSADAAGARRLSGWQPRRWQWVALALALTIWGLTDVRNRGRVDPHDPLVHKTDLTCYTVAGAAFFDGRNPYDVSNPRGWRYLYPPLFAILLAPLAALDTQWQSVVWFFLSLAFCWGCYRESLRIWRHFVTDRRRRRRRRIAPLARPARVARRDRRGDLGAAGTQLLATGASRHLGRLSDATGLAADCREPLVAGRFCRRGALAGAVVVKLTPALPVLLLLGMLCLAAGGKRWAGVSARHFAVRWGNGGGARVVFPDRSQLADRHGGELAPSAHLGRAGRRSSRHGGREQFRLLKRSQSKLDECRRAAGELERL